MYSCFLSRFSVIVKPLLKYEICVTCLNAGLVFFMIQQQRLWKDLLFGEIVSNLSTT